MNIKLLVCIGCITILPACSTLPKYVPQPIEFAFDTPTQDTALAQLIMPLKEQNPELTGYHVLYNPLEALAARLHLINKAEKTLDLQYYIWDNDKIGALAIYHLIQAADRGVKVRLLIDDNNAKEMEGVYLALDQHVNINVRLYNPYRFRKYRAMDLVLDLKRMNRRMHNKSFIADNQISLIGGRNMSNQYYNASDNYQFSDVDVLLVGAASDQIIHSFDEYWNDSYAYPVQHIVNQNQHHLRFESLKRQVTEHYEKTTVQNYLQLTDRFHAFENWLNQSIQLNWVEAHVVKDAPSKIRDEAVGDDLLYQQLNNLIHYPTTNLDIVSAYFVPTAFGAQMLQALTEKGVDVRVLTNSYRANDVPVVHAFYSKYRQELLENDVKLYEFLSISGHEDDKATRKTLAEKVDINLQGLSRSRLHTKMMAIDSEQVFIGSYNFDPRSANLNTEIAVLLKSPALAKRIHQTMDESLPHYAYQVMLDANRKLTWKLTQPNQNPKIYSKEPKMKWWNKALLKAVSFLPIEGFM